MRRFLFALCLLFCCSRAAQSADTPDSAYDAVRGCYRALLQAPQSAPAAYAACVAQFVRVAQAFPDHPRAAESWYSIGLVETVRYQRTHDRSALDNALKGFRTVSNQYDTHRLADDALLRAAQLTAGGLDKASKAQRLLQQLLRQHPHGDQVEAARALQKKLSVGGRYVLPSAMAPEPTTATATAPPTQKPVNPTVTVTPPRSTTLAGVRIVIDPGHGGHDPGAKGPTGVLEKQVALDMSQRLAERLRTQYGATVSLTRTADRYLTLGERNRVGNRAKADLFLSIHANAAENPAARGVQTYYLNNASDAAAKRLAARENAAAGTNQTELDSIMSTMLQNAFTADSAALARAVQSALVTTLRTRFDRIEDDRVQSALFYVLVGAKSPAILIETSFVSNPEEEQRLRDSAYQQTVAAGIAEGVARFWTSGRKKDL